jgi:hypothetical protein
LEPPESISNSEVKHIRADDSVGFPHVKVGHRQGFITESGSLAAFFYVEILYLFTTNLEPR